MAFAELLAGYLVATGWREDKPGHWLEPGQRGRRNTTYHGLVSAVQSQIEREFWEENRERLERVRLGIVTEGEGR